MKPADQFLQYDQDKRLKSKKDVARFERFGSDLHLGTSGCCCKGCSNFSKRPNRNLVFGRRYCRRPAPKRRWFWDQTHNNIAQQLKKAKKGTNVILFPVITMRTAAVYRLIWWHHGAR